VRQQSLDPMADYHPAHPSKVEGDGKRRRWPTALPAVIVLLIVSGIWLSGPGSRLICAKILRSQLESAEFGGAFTVEEVGLGGVKLRDVALAGPGVLRAVRGDSLSINYRFCELFYGRIRAINLSNFHITLDLDRDPERDTPIGPGGLAEALRDVREQMAPIDLNAENIRIMLVRGDEPVSEFQPADLRHRPETGNFHVRLESIGAADGDQAVPVANDGNAEEEEAAGQEVDINWGPEGLMIERLELMAGIVFESLSLRHAEDGDLQADGLARINGAALRVRLVENLRIARVSLEEGAVDLGILMQRLDQEVDLAGTVDGLDLTLRNILLPPGRWEVAGTASAPRARYEEWELEEVALEIEKNGNTANLGFSGSFYGTTFALSGAARFDPERADEAGEWWHGAEFTGDLQTANLKPALAELWRREPDADDRPVPGGRAHLDFSAALDGGSLARATADYRLEALEVEGGTLPPVTGRATWDAAADRLEAGVRHQTAPDAERGTLRLDGAWQFEDERYEGSAEFDQYDLNVLAGFLRPFGIAMPAGNVTGTWEGSGVLTEDAGRHAGTVALDESLLDFEDRPPFSGSVQARYDWPGDVEVERLRVEQEGGTLELNGTWSDGRVNLDELSLIDPDGEVLLSGQAQLPLAPEVRSLDDFFAQEGELSASFETSDLSVAQVRDLLPGVDIPASGVISGTLEIGGTLQDPVADGKIAMREVAAEALPDIDPTDISLTFRAADRRLQVQGRLTQADAVLDVDADVPLSTDVRSMADFLAQEDEISIQMNLADFPVRQLQQFLPDGFIQLPEEGVMDGELTVSGTLEEPTVESKIEVRDLSFRFPDGLPSPEMSLNLTTDDGQLHVLGRAVAEGIPPAVLSGGVSFRPRRWLDDPSAILDEEADLRLVLRGLEADRFTAPIPGVAEFSGLADIDVRLQGRLGSPDLQGSANLRDGSLRPAADGLPVISDISLDLQLNGQDMAWVNLNMRVGGGPVSLTGRVKLTDPTDPVVDLTLAGHHTLIWRDDTMSARGNVDLRLAGPLDAAHLSGTLGIVESFFYPEFTPLPDSPFRIPRKRGILEMAADLVDAGDLQPTGLLPKPMGDWTLDVNVVTHDPILIRANQVEAAIFADFRAGGTLASPWLDGVAKLTEGEAQLPLTKLRVSGTAVFAPVRGLEPLLDFRGTSRIGPYHAAVILSGLPTHPEITLAADPPLPQTEVWRLLATGSPNLQLGVEESTEAAARYFIDELRHTELPVVRRLGRRLEPLEDIKVHVGKNDPYNLGRLRSATIAFTDRVLLSSPVDENLNSRGVLIYLLRFR